MSIETKKATRLQNVLVDAHLEAEAPHGTTYHWQTPKQKSDALRSWVKEFEDFIRDHRSQDAVQLSVVEDRKDLCSACGNEWETDSDEGRVCCAYCGAEVEVA